MQNPRSLLSLLALAASVAHAQTNQFDSRIESYVGLRYPCGGAVQPVLRIQNVGGETMTSCDIDILKNGLTESTFNWVLGSPAATNEFRQPALPSMIVQPGDELEFRILTVNGEPDQGALENILVVPMTDEKGDAPSYQAQVRVLTDGSPEETSWKIRNALGAVVAQSPVYAEGGVLVETPVSLSADQCYSFEVLDAGGDGFGEARELGYAKLMSLGEEVAAASGAFGASYRKVAQTGTDNGCLPTQLTATADPVVSCGAMNIVLGASTIHATAVPGANKYMFRFTNVPGQPAYARNNTSATRSLAINNWATLPLKKGRTYNVQVRASFDNGATYCDYGPACTIRLPHAAIMQVRDLASLEEDAAEAMFNIYPNPSADGAFSIAVDAYDEEEPVHVEVLSLTGTRVVEPMLFNLTQEGVVRIDPRAPLSSGVYLVRITVGAGTTTQRLLVR